MTAPEPAAYSDSASPPPSREREDGDGRWGENAQGHISVTAAREEYNELSRQLTETAKHSNHIHRPRTNEAPSLKAIEAADSSGNNASDGSDEVGDRGSFDLPDFLTKGIIDPRTPSGGPTKRLGLLFKNVTVRAVASGSRQVKTLPEAVLNSFGPDLYRFATRLIPALKPKSRAPITELIRDFTGTVCHGEIMLVLGRPGSGCSTFLKTIANQRDEYAAVDGEVFYGPISAEDQRRRFRGEVAYCEEDDVHFPSLTVWQTLWFALRNKTRKKEAWTVPVVLDSFLQMFGIEHTRNTLVGNEHMRGVSGGERKRVSLAETLATKASVVCWDNSTRGLDASTALSFAKSLRVYTDVTGRTTLVTLYQAGESIYKLVDKVLVIDDGRMLFQGPADEAKQYFEDLGYRARARQTTSDFLTSVADVSVRQFQPGKEATAPKTPEELERAFRESEHYRRILGHVDSYERNGKSVNSDKHRTFETTVKESKSKTVLNDSVYTVSFAHQVMACTQRQAWLIWGDKSSLVTKAWIIVANALIVGSLFFSIGNDTASAYARTGISFFAVAFIGWLQFAELLPAVTGRATIERQRAFAFYRPSAVTIARVVTDLPMILCMVALFSTPIYFLGRFDVDGGKFWIFFLLIYTGTLTMTSMFRMFAALSSNIDDAVRFVTIILNLLFMFAGYVLPKTVLMNDAPWFGWFHFAQPMSYVYEAILGNEFTGRQMECSEMMRIPRGPGVDSDYQGCSFAGATRGSTSITGDAYIQASFGFSRANLWRNFGINIAFGVIYVLVTVIAVEKIQHKSSSAQSLVWARKKQLPAPVSSKAPGKASDEVFEHISDGRSVFTFKDICYTVPTPAGPLQLLTNVSGYAKPGKMIALMGSSGAGKTTLLNTIAQRQCVGVVSGDMLVNGKPLDAEFQRGTGFCEQMDLHEPTATIREALEFSALLRQEARTPRAEKLAYVDHIISLLELHELQGALISSLSVEQRKRVTIGVELAARPKLLLFLDEPTSGLDSQSAYSIVRFLRKLSDAGQAIICTIHQPSSDLIEQFDMILALSSPGGKPFYFGPLGQNGSTVVDYFAKRGADCPPRRNIAEFVLETASRSGSGPGRTDWNDEWLKSDERKALIQEIDDIVASPAATESSASATAGTDFAASTFLQCQLLTNRMFIQHWRDPSYMYGRLFVFFVMGLFNGFTFWQLGNDVASLQNRMFSVGVLVFFVPPAVVNSVIFKFFGNRNLWESRELPSRTYGWVAFVTASIVTEIPVSIIAGTVYYLLWYFPAGFPTDAATAGYSYAMVILYSLFMASWGQWIGAFGPSVTVISNVLPFFFIMVALFNGILVPYESFPDFWKYWIYYLMPSTWHVRGMISVVFPSIAITCAPAELASFDPPPSKTCGEYASAFLTEVVNGAGYLVDADATSNCEYCAYKSGPEYMGNLNVQPGDRGLGIGLVAAFVVANWALVYGLLWACRVKGWSFGFGLLPKALDGLKKLFQKQKVESTA